MHSLLSKHQILVFYGRTSEFLVGACLPVLSEKEIVRSEKYLLPSDKNRYIISRAILKRLLSRFLSVDERKIELDCGKNGKLFLAENRDFQFNSSHSDDAFAIALTIGNETGIDIESLNRKPNIPLLENMLFTPAELKLFQTLQTSMKQEVFINCWTKKEAILKVSGDGLTKAMNELEVLFIKDNHFHMGKKDGQTSCFLESCTLMDNYRVSVAAKGEIHRTNYFSLHSSELVSHKILPIKPSQ